MLLALMTYLIVIYIYNLDIKVRIIQPLCLYKSVICQQTIVSTHKFRITDHCRTQFLDHISTKQSNVYITNWFNIKVMKDLVY